MSAGSGTAGRSADGAAYCATDGAAVRALTLDLDDTLWPGAEAIARAEAKVQAWLEERAPALAQAMPPPAFALFRRTIASELPSIAHDFTALRREAMKRALGLHGEDPSLAEPALAVFLEERSRVVFYADSAEALERLRARFPLAALTNGNTDLARAGIAGSFSAIVSAASAGAAKPDPRIFRAACDELGFPPGAVLHVGDDPDLDVRGSERAGMRAAWINRARREWPGERASAPEFHDLLSLCDWLGA